MNLRGHFIADALQILLVVSVASLFCVGVAQVALQHDHDRAQLRECLGVAQDFRDTAASCLDTLEEAAHVDEACTCFVPERIEVQR